ncbi:MAG: acetylornithine deacetylase/succinyl-diaminopimelate desuccinylase family protein [Alphaproteobacteria bacterium]|jgi:succinyl-diaminopimelate desuccinylase|nr:acetylornithine deacetylase/succinyl-diaminopimelate desuccinylase family protein [Alphaproteobacteria bacterium]
MTSNQKAETSSILEQLREEIAARREALISTTCDLLAIPTLNPPGQHYRDICDWLDRRLQKSGFQTHLLRATGTPGDSDKYPRWNIIARHEGKQPGQTVHFNSHTDIVTVGEGWTKDPFGGDREGDIIWGRGACDMKGGLAASIIAAEAFIARFPDYHGAIEISGTADEETGGYGGVAWLAEQGWFNPQRVDHVIIPEPLNKDRICLGHRGVWWAEIETKGRIAHGSMPFLGDCAVRHMGAVLEEMEASLFPLLASRTTEMPVVPEQARQSTLNINSIHGGLPVPEAGYTGFPSACVPDKCVITIDRRYLMEEEPDRVRGEIEQMLDKIKSERPGFDWEIRELWQVHPSMTEKDAPVVGAVGRAIEAVMGQPPDFVVSPGTYDQKHIDRIGKLKNCIAYGPGILELAHQPDEWISIKDMMDSAAVMGLTLADLLIPQTGG